MGFRCPSPSLKRVRTGPSGVPAFHTCTQADTRGRPPVAEWLFRRDWACLHVCQRLQINSLLPGHGLVSRVRRCGQGTGGAISTFVP